MLNALILGAIIRSRLGAFTPAQAPLQPGIAVPDGTLPDFVPIPTDESVGYSFALLGWGSFQILFHTLHRSDQLQSELCPY